MPNRSDTPLQSNDMTVNFGAQYTRTIKLYLTVFGLSVSCVSAVVKDKAKTKY